jgi:hypothetical protein
MGRWTEDLWLNCATPVHHLPSLRGLMRSRQYRLFACGCCRRVWHLLGAEARAAVEAAEAYADGALSARELAGAQALIPPPATAAAALAASAAWAASAPTSQIVGLATSARVQAVSAVPPARRADEEAAQNALLRDLVGNPFRPVNLPACWLSWQDGTLPKLARAVHAGRAFERLPILADALEEAGCADAAILDHCRGGGVHVRGCWAVERLLGRA